MTKAVQQSSPRKIPRTHHYEVLCYITYLVSALVESLLLGTTLSELEIVVLQAGRVSVKRVRASGGHLLKAEEARGIRSGRRCAVQSTTTRELIEVKRQRSGRVVVGVAHMDMAHAVTSFPWAKHAAGFAFPLLQAKKAAFCSAQAEPICE